MTTRQARPPPVVQAARQAELTGQHPRHGVALARRRRYEKALVVNAGVAYDARVFRRWSAAVLVAAIAGMPLMPQEHVHERDEHGHHEMLVHRHAEAHGVAHHQVDHAGVLDDDDAVATTIEPVFTPSAVVSLVFVPVLAPLPASTAVFEVSFHTSPYLTRPIHGPPRLVRSLRAPPLSSFL